MVNKKETIDLKDLFLRYARYWPYIMFCVIIALVLAYFKTQFSTPYYWVSSKFLLQEEQKNMLLDLTGMGGVGIGKGRGMMPSTVNETHLIRSRPYANLALEKLKFDVEYYNIGTFVNSEIYKNTPILVEVDWQSPQISGGEILISWNNTKKFTVQFIDEAYKYTVPGEEKSSVLETPRLKKSSFNFGEWVDLPYSKFKVDLASGDSSGELIVKFKDRQSLIGNYTGEDLIVMPIDPSSTILELSLVTKHPVKGRDYLNQLMEVFLMVELEEKNRLAGNTVNFIDSQISGLSDSLSLIENQLGTFRSTNRTYDISTEGSAIFSQLSELEGRVSQEKFKRNYYRNLQDYLVREEYNEIIVPSGIGIEDPILNSLIENLIQLQGEKSRFLATQTEASPAVKEVTRKIKGLNSSLKELLKNVDSNAQLLITDLESRIAKIESSFSRLPQTEQNLMKIQREFTLNENIYNFLLQRRAEAAISKASNTASSKIIEYAIPNFSPISPKPLQNYIVAIVLGIFFPVSLITIKDFFNNKILDIKELENGLHIPLMARVGILKQKNNLVVLTENREPVTEAFRSLRSNIAYAFPKDKQVTILVTSSISGEGKTFIAINLASVCSLSGKKTILIGCDLRKPKIYNDFGLSNSIGLSTYLSEQEDDIKVLIQPTKYDNLDILSSGPIPPNPSELLSSNRFEQMIVRLKEAYDVIILDTPPIGLVSETLDMVKVVDLTFYVLRYNYSKKIFIDHVNKLKDQKNIKNFYGIFNGVSDKEMQYGGYGHKYYAEEEKKPLIKRIFHGMKKRAAM